MSADDRSDLRASLDGELTRLREEITVLNSHRFVQIHNSWLRLVGFQFLRGLAFGLGTVVGASVLVSVLVYVLSQFDWVPILGDWTTRIVEEIQSNQN